MTTAETEPGAKTAFSWNSRVTDLLGCRYPIIQGAYGGFGTAAIAGPVSKAGGMGIITAGACKTAEGLREEIEKVRAMTDNPFGVNLTVGICPDIVNMLRVAIECRVPALFTAAYKAEELGIQAKEAGIPWVHKVATVKHARAAERQGADAIVIVGIEGSGFKSVIQLPTLTNITSAVKLIDAPIIAAGGLGDAHGMVAALGMGAEAVYMGTAFMATKECQISDRYKQVLVDSQPWDSVVRDRSLAPPSSSEYERIMKQRGKMEQGEWLMKLETVINKGDPDADHSAVPSGWSADLKDSAEEDSADQEDAFRNSGGSLAVGVIDEVKSAQEFIAEIMTEAEEIMVRSGVGSWLRAGEPAR
ncbi:MAG TPA: nitronate monooxygenase [Dehalococcoidia bacterium]|nr:nitronate monooxygenase [Dehalococcoidia bacterium]